MKIKKLLKHNLRRAAMTLALILTCATAWAQSNDFTNDGNRTYTIHNANGWTVFCSALNSDLISGFSGCTIKLDANIQVTSMAGSNGHEFRGTFDGQGHTLTVSYNNTDNEVPTAPFSYVNGATIRNLIVGGTISGTAYRAAGIVGETVTYMSYITNCVSSVNISSGRYTGGFSIGGLVTIEGCVFNGKINGTEKSGGFVGYSNPAASITNSLFDPQDGSSIDGGTFYYAGGGNITLTNCYYTRALGTVQGKERHSITAGDYVTVANAGTPVNVYATTGITSYGTGIKYNNVLYAGNADNVSLSLTPPVGMSISSATYTPEGESAADMTHQTGNVYSFTMPNANVTINATFTLIPITYLDENGEEQTCTDHTVLTGSETSLGTDGETTWYVVCSNISHTGRIKCYGKVNLILADGCTMTVTNSYSGGYAIDGTSSTGLAIYGQTAGTGTLNVNGNDSGFVLNSYLNICGGTINAQADSYAIFSKHVTISGGRVTAQGGEDGISSTKVTISGGHVTAIGGSDAHCYAIYGGNEVTISGGRVTAQGGEDGIFGGFITISGGRVTAQGGNQGYGIEAYNINLGWSHSTDFIKANSYHVYSSYSNVSILEGCTFLTDDNPPLQVSSGTVNDLSLINGKTLTPDISSVLTVSTDGNTYTILNAIGWGVFCNLLADNTKGYFDNKTVNLGADIGTAENPITRMAGSAYHDFTGTFDGQGHTLTVCYGTAESPINGDNAAPFRNAVSGVESGCTIEKLHVAGDIYTSKKYAGGLVGTQYGEVTINNCRSSVTIHSTTSGDGTHGGIVGNNGNSSSSALTINGCLFDGKLLTEGETPTTNCSGFVGYKGGTGTVTITNSLYAPASIEEGETEITDGSATFARSGNNSNLTITHCYYTRPLGTVQGQQVCTHAAVSPMGDATHTYDLSGITMYNNGMLHGETFYYDPERNFLHTVEGYGNNNDKWVFIASPITINIAPSEVGNLLGQIISTDSDHPLYNFDLYRFNQSAEKVWENYHQHNDSEAPFMIEKGQGYLYATKEPRTLVFVGERNTGTESSVQVPLIYDGNALFAGFNLVGNPFTENATLDKSYYVMNAEGTGIVPTAVNGSTPIAPCTGVLVQATGTNQSVTFTKVTAQQNASNNQGNLQIALTQANMRGNAQLDNAIVSFNEGSQLGKFYFGEQNGNIYIPQGGEEYAIVSIGGRDVPWRVSTGVNEIPVNFKAKENGEYTITVNPENVEMTYLHLIDNMTGADVDLLTPPACGHPLTEGDVPLCKGGQGGYTFTAKATDYESRFKLVFASVCEDADGDNETFAFFSNGNWIITNEGQATLQVIDLNGRILSSETVNGSVSKGINQPAGVYMIRLINGENVKMQKIVVE